MIKPSQITSFKKYKCVCVTPAGLRQYMRYLVPQIIASPWVDRYDIWVNTLNKSDLAFLDALSQKYPKIRLVQQPEGRVNACVSICAFFQHAVNDDTIYIRLDDDIIWLEPNFFEEIINFRLAHPKYFWVSPLTINNAICTHLLQRRNLIHSPKYITANCFDELAWADGAFAANLHKWFIEKITDQSYKNLHGGGELLL